jgi:hypothetical protein
MLHIKKRGTKSVRRNDKVRRRLSDQMSKRGNEQRYRPAKSPMLNTRKWAALNRSGCVSGFVGLIDAVMGGNTAYNGVCGLVTHSSTKMKLEKFTKVMTNT